jgi:uncharacterized integral membrane protein
MNSVQLRLLGESVREIGVLILVFVPLDVWVMPASKAVEVNYPSWLAWAYVLSVDHWRILFFAVGGLVVIYYGIKIESRAIVELSGREGDD